MMIFAGNGGLKGAGIWLLLIAAIFAAPDLPAQDVLPGTPSELETFRLDKPPPKREEPKPETRPPPTSQPATENPQPAPRPVTPLPQPKPAPARQPAVKQARPAPQPAQQTAPSAPTAASRDADNAPLSGEPAAPGEGAPIAEAEAEQTAPIQTGASPADAAGGARLEGTSWEMWLAIAGILGVLAAALMLYASRRKKAAVPADDMALPGRLIDPPEPVIEEDDPHMLAIEDAAMPGGAEIPIQAAPVAKKSVEEPAAKPKKPRAQPELEMRFIPEHATLGFTNLTLRGELKIVNHGKAMARNVRLRSAAICANERQDAMISAFNQGVTGSESEPLENIRKGERVTIEIEVSLPRSEISSYAYQDQQICVPIILAELGWSGMAADSGRKLHVAAMIGRESDPPRDKMGPLRIDLGPRSFNALGQRPVAV
ncbi:MAG: hypothetical protein V3V15_11995 [Sphingorhabdus sp.]